MVKIIVAAVIKGLAVILIFVYTIGFALMLIKVISPEKFLITTMTYSIVGFPLLLVQKYYNKISEPQEIERNKKE